MAPAVLAIATVNAGSIVAIAKTASPNFYVDESLGINTRAK